MLFFGQKAQKKVFIMRNDVSFPVGNLIYQPELTPYLPEVKYNRDYARYQRLIERIDQIIKLSQLDFKFAEAYLVALKRAGISENPDFSFTSKQLKKYTEQSITATRCNILGYLIQEPFRKLSTHIAESGLLQQFCQVSRMGYIHVPSKSRLQRFSDLFPEKTVRELTAQLTHFSCSENNHLSFDVPLTTEDIFLDATCVKSNIHYPVDRLLLRDGMVTILKAIVVIRKHGIKHRITSVDDLIKEINRLSIKMTHSRRKADSVRERKKIFRGLKKLEKRVRNHGLRYRELLIANWGKTDLTEKQMLQIKLRMDNVLDKLPVAVKQAHSRIISGIKIPSHKKSLSLYDDRVRVVVRGKSGDEVEFGNTLFLGEQSNGVISDWKLYQASASGDSQITRESLERTCEYEFSFSSVSGDRGCFSKENRDFLGENNVFSALCPRTLQEFIECLKSEKFQQLQNRRSQTEGRIGIFKNNIIDSPIRNRKFDNKEKNIAWGVLAHNLWVLARLPEKTE